MLHFDTLTIGDILPSRTYVASNVSLFLYNAAIWNPHRIHYDERYTTDIEKHPAVVIDGPLQGDWLTQVVLAWLGTDGSLLECEYTNRRASYLGDRLTAGGRIVALNAAQREVSLELEVRDQNDVVTTPGRAVVRLLR
jgi:hydroxyacyl-ACP dehydratase HTD2-like protein with hotdog domain